MNPANYSFISFPWLNLECNPPRVMSLGPVTIHIYGLIIAVGLMLAVVYGCRRSKHFGIREDDIIDGVLWIVPFAILCARLYYCIFSWEEYAANPIKVLYIWEGGLAIYGGVIGAAIGGSVVMALLGAFVFHWPVLVVYGCTCLDEVGKIPWVMARFRKYKWVQDLTR